MKPTLLWAMDPFEDTAEEMSEAARLAEDWRKRTGCRIQPVYVLSTRQVGLSLELEYDSLHLLEEESKKRMSALLKDLRVSRIEPPHAIVSYSWSRAQDVDALSEFAAQAGASLILMNTHARTGLKRLLVGSFTEATLLRSRVPVLTVNPQAKRPPSLDHILFPTEFGRYAFRTFARVVGLAREIGARVTLVHVIPSVMGIEAMGGAYGFPIPPEIVEEANEFGRRRARRRFDAWRRHSCASGVEIDYRVLSGGKPIAEGILAIARKIGAGLITMEAESGWMRVALLGSVSRQVVRHAQCPVWVIRPRLALARRSRAKERSARRAA